MKLKLKPGFVLLACFAAATAHAEPDVTPAISEKGDLLFSDDFDAPEIKPAWVALHKTQWTVDDGTLRGKPSPEEYQQARKAKGLGHTGGTPSSRLEIPTDDCVVLFRFKLTDDLKGAHFGFNDGTYKTGTGHVCRFVVSVREGLALRKDENAKLEGDEDVTLATNEFKPKADTWYWMMLEIVGDKMAAQISGSPVLKASHPRIDIPKDQINLPTRGGGTILYDHVRVWTATPID